MRINKNLSIVSFFLIFAACADVNSSVSKSSPDDSPSKYQIPTGVEKASALFQQGKYSEAATQYRRLSKSKDKSVAEKTQYQLAYTLAFYKNPKRDCQEALNEFQFFVKRFPGSPLKEEAENWIYLLNQFLSKKLENDVLRDDIKKLVDIDIEAEQKQNQLK